MEVAILGRTVFLVNKMKNGAIPLTSAYFQNEDSEWKICYMDGQTTLFNF